MPIPEDADQAEEGAEALAPGQARGRVNISDKFTQDVIDDIREAKNVQQLAIKAVKSYDNREKYLKPEYVDDAISRDNWYKWIFRIHYDADQARNSDQRYIEYIHAIDEYISFIQLPPEQQQQLIKQKREQHSAASDETTTKNTKTI